MTKPLSLLHQMTLETPTEFWSDSCEVTSLQEAIRHGATGATSNPVIVRAAIDADRDRWIRFTEELIRTRPHASEVDIAWGLVDQAAVEAAEVLRPVFERHKGRRGRLCVQVNPELYRCADAMVEQGTHFGRLAPNIGVKVPATKAGIEAIEELTARGIVINATVSYSVAQTIAVADAVERGFARLSTDVDAETITPWVTLMVGRIDDHLRDEVRRTGVEIDIDRVRHASIAVMRRAYTIFEERGYRATLLAAAMRSHHHWSEFIGGRLVVTIPPKWQREFNRSPIEVRRRIDDPVDPNVVDELQEGLVDFRRAYEPDGLAIEEFEHFGASIKTLRQFLGGYHELLRFVRDVMLPPPEGHRG